MSLTQEKISLQSVFDEVTESVADWAAESGITLQSVKTNVVVNVDREKLNRVIFNLISNAIKFSQPGGMVILRASAEASMAEITVTDSGSGVAPDMVATIFERFQQAGQLDRDKGGSGLGLTICKEIVQLHGGKIWVSANSPRGSIFHLTIPLI